MGTALTPTLEGYGSLRGNYIPERMMRHARGSSWMRSRLASDSLANHFHWAMPNSGMGRSGRLPNASYPHRPSGHGRSSIARKSNSRGSTMTIPEMKARDPIENPKKIAIAAYRRQRGDKQHGLSLPRSHPPKRFIDKHTYSFGEH